MRKEKNTSPRKINHSEKNRKEATLAHLLLRSFLFKRVSHFKEISRLAFLVKILIGHFLHPNVVVGILVFLINHRRPSAFLNLCCLPFFAYIAVFFTSGLLLAMITGFGVVATISVFFLSFVHLEALMLYPFVVVIFGKRILFYLGPPAFTFTYPRKITAIWNATFGEKLSFLRMCYTYPRKYEFVFYLVAALDAFFLVLNLAHL